MISEENFASRISQETNRRPSRTSENLCHGILMHTNSVFNTWQQNTKHKNLLQPWQLCCFMTLSWETRTRWLCKFSSGAWFKVHIERQNMSKMLNSKVICITCNLYTYYAYIFSEFQNLLEFFCHFLFCEIEEF